MPDSESLATPPAHRCALSADDSLKFESDWRASCGTGGDR